MLAEKAYLFTPQIAALPVAGATSRFQSAGFTASDAIMSRTFVR